MASRHQINRVDMTEGLEGELSQSSTQAFDQSDDGICHLRGHDVHPRVVESLIQTQGLHVFELSHML